MLIATVVGSIALVTTIVIMIIAMKSSTNIKADYNSKLKDVVDQINSAQYSEYEFDKKNKGKIDQLDRNLEDTRKSYVNKKELSTDVTTQQINVSGNLHTGKDTSSGIFTAKESVKVGSSFMNKDGYIYAGSWIDGADVQGRNSVKAGASGAILKSDGTVTGKQLCIDNVCVTKQDLMRLKNPPINCQVGTWSSWGACSKTCGGGVQTRTRQIVQHVVNDGAPCPHLIETQECNGQPCVPNIPAVNCQVSGWSSWGACSKPCGGGSQTRTRTVITPASGGGNGCPILTESQSCNTQTCVVPVNCQVSDWGPWNSCSKTCGGGTQSRTRTIIQQPANGGSACPVLTENQTCNTQACVTTKTGQAQFESQGIQKFQVPEGVYSICILAVGAGADAISAHYGRMYPGGGGALAYVNNVPVLPGQVLNIQTGFPLINSLNGPPTDSIVKMNNDLILFAGGGTPGAGGHPQIGANYQHLSHAGYKGGGSVAYEHEPVTNGVSAGGGGGAGGFYGHGGNGGLTYTAKTATSYYDNKYNYVTARSDPPNGNTPIGGNYDGGGGAGVNPDGEPRPPNYGSGRNGGFAGGGGGFNYNAYGGPSVGKGAQGIVRIIWGPGRAFPGTKTGSSDSYCYTSLPNLPNSCISR